MYACKTKKKLCMQTTVETYAKHAIDANLFRLRSTNPKKKPGPLDCFIFKNKKCFFFQKCSNIFEQIFFLLFIFLFIFATYFAKNFQIHMNNAESAESKEKSNFRFLDFYFTSYVHFRTKNHLNFNEFSSDYLHEK